MMGVDHLLLVRDVEVDQAVVNLLVGDGPRLRKVLEDGGTVIRRDCACCGAEYRTAVLEGERKSSSKYCPCCHLLIQEFRNRYVTSRERINAIRALLLVHTDRGAG